MQFKIFVTNFMQNKQTQGQTEDKKNATEAFSFKYKGDNIYNFEPPIKEIKTHLQETKITPTNAAEHVEKIFKIMADDFKFETSYAKELGYEKGEEPNLEKWVSEQYENQKQASMKLGRRTP